MKKSRPAKKITKKVITVDYTELCVALYSSIQHDQRMTKEIHTASPSVFSALGFG